MILTVLDESGEPVDPRALGVDRLVDLIRGRPAVPDPEAPDDEALDLAFRGPAIQSLDAVDQTTRQIAALRAACVAAVSDELPRASESDRVLDELSCALGVSRRSAQYTHRVSENLRSQPEVWAALFRGELDGTRAQILAEALFEIPLHDEDGALRPTGVADRAQLFDEGLAYAQEHTARRLDLYLHRRLAALGCDERPRRRRAGLAERGVWIGHRGDGTADLTARLASEDAERVYRAIRECALADRNGDPVHDAPASREPLDMWLAAALVDLILGPCGPGPDLGADPGAPDFHPAHVDRTRGRTKPWRTRVHTVVTVTIPIESLAGLSEQPGIIDGYGAIPAEVARRLAAGDSRWRHVLTSRATGAVLDVGTLSYRPPAALDRHVRLRDGTCRFPGCEVPATECDLDHLIPFPDGPTSAENLHALCRRHHDLKHQDGWQVQALPGHALRWISPQGSMAVTHPDDTHRHVA